MAHATLRIDSIVAVGRHRKNLSIEDAYNFGPEVRNESPEDKGNSALASGHYEDALNAYSLALAYDFTFAARILSNRAEAHLALGNFKYAYIDANEALKLHANIPCEMTKLEPAELGQSFRRRAIALAATGHADRAVLDLQVANRAGSLSQEACADAMDVVLRSASNQRQENSRETGPIHDYDPLESDSKPFGRKLLLADVNRFVINGWSSPDGADPKFDFRRWLSIQGIRKHCGEILKPIRKNNRENPLFFLQSRTMEMHIDSVLLCFTNDGWLNRAASALIHDQLFAYANAKESLKLLLTIGFRTIYDPSAFGMAQCLEKLGLYQDAKKAIEFSLRTVELAMDADVAGLVSRTFERLLMRPADNPKVSLSVVESRNPLCLSDDDPSSRILMKVRPAYISALGSIYGPTDKATKPFADVTESSPREDIAAVARSTEEAYERNDLSEARRLYTIAIISTQRRNAFYLIRRAQIAYLEGRSEFAFVDATEVIKLNPKLPTAHELQAKALLRLGFVTKAKAVVERLKSLDSSYVLERGFIYCLMHMVVKDAPSCPASYLENYDPEMADEYADGMTFTAAQRKVHREAINVERARALVSQQGLFEQVIKLLDGPISSKPLPGALSLRAEAYLKLGEPRKALADAEEAIKLDKYSHDALVVRARSFAEIGLYSTARRATQEYLKLVPGDAAMKEFSASIKDKADTSMLPSADLDETEQCAYGETPESTDKDAHGYMQHFVRLAMSEGSSSVARSVKDIYRDGWPVVDDADNLTCLSFRSVASRLLSELASTKLERKQLAVELQETKDRLTEKTREVDKLKSQPKGVDGAKTSALVHVERIQDHPRESIIISEADKKLAKLQKALHEKETALEHAVQVNDVQNRRIHDLAQQLENATGPRIPRKFRVEVTEENKALKEELSKLKSEKASEDKELAETKAKNQRLQVEMTTMQASNNEHTEKLRQVNSKLQAALQATKHQGSRLAIEQQKVENLTERINELLDASSATASAVQAPNVTTEPNELLTALWPSLLSKADGFKIDELLRELKDIAEIDGDDEARKHGYGSLKEFLHSTKMRDKLDFIYLGRPTAEVRHHVEEQQHGLQASVTKWRKKFDWEKKRADSLDSALRNKEDEVTRKDTLIRKLANHPSCPICMDVQSDTTFTVGEEDGSHTICGHLLCSDCAPGLRVCHFCRKPVVNRIKIYTAQNAL